MNVTTARALFVGLLVAVWVWVSGMAKLNRPLWAPIVALGCYFAAGGGVSGLQKCLFVTTAGVVWVLVTEAIIVAVGGTRIVTALLWGAMACAIMFTARVPLLSFTAGTFAATGVALGLRVNTVNEGIRAAIALAIGALLGFLAERIAGAIAARRS